MLEDIANQIIEHPELQEVFDIQFLKKIVKITSEQLQIQMKSSVMLLQCVLQKAIISKRLLNLKGAERTVA
jgi:hypothetical protein